MDSTTDNDSRQRTQTAPPPHTVKMRQAQMESTSAAAKMRTERPLDLAARVRMSANITWISSSGSSGIAARAARWAGNKGPRERTSTMKGTDSLRIVGVSRETKRGGASGDGEKQRAQRGTTVRRARQLAAPLGRRPPRWRAPTGWIRCECEFDRALGWSGWSGHARGGHGPPPKCDAGEIQIRSLDRQSPKRWVERASARVWRSRCNGCASPMHDSTRNPEEGGGCIGSRETQATCSRGVQILIISAVLSISRSLSVAAPREEIPSIPHPPLPPPPLRLRHAHGFPSAPITNGLTSLFDLRR